MLAHLVQTGFGDFYDGLAHWALTPNDLMVVLAFVLLAGSGGQAAAKGTVLALPSAWLLGGLIGFQLPALGALPVATALTVGLAGLLVALNRRLPTTALTIGALVAGALHGLANGSVMLVEGRDRLALLGVVTAVAVVTLVGSALVVPIEKPVARVVIRVAGSWLAAIALLLLGWQFRAQ